VLIVPMVEAEDVSLKQEKKVPSGAFFLSRLSELRNAAIIGLTMNKVKVYYTGQDVKAPHYQSAGAAGADIYAQLEDPIVIKPMERAMVPTGMSIALPQGFEAQIRPRSGLAWKQGLTVLNSPGTIDCDYRGEVRILLINLGEKDVTVSQGDRIAQMIIAPYIQGEFILKEKLDETLRGAGGFGSTGV
jgi:dUTP pyrophosphatase